MVPPAWGWTEANEGVDQQMYEGRTLNEWDVAWESLGLLSDERWRGIRDIGVYRFWLRADRPLYIGKVTYTGSTGSDGGFHWRLQQYWAGSHAGRTTGSAKLIHSHKDTLQVGILRLREKPMIAALEIALIERHRPEWNMQGTG